MRHVFALVVSVIVLGAVGAPRVSFADAPQREGQRSDVEKRGCCSHHHGVCGCSNSVVMCCDGSGSPSCTC